MVQIQISFTESAQETSHAAKQSFYRKNFFRAKGIINEVREVADAITGLAASCESANSGMVGIEEVPTLS